MKNPGAIQMNKDSVFIYAVFHERENPKRKKSAR